MVVVVREEQFCVAWSNDDNEVSTQKKMMTVMTTLQCTEEEECTELTLEF